MPRMQKRLIERQNFAIYCALVFASGQIYLAPALASDSAYIGNLVSLKFHINCCPYAQMMSLSKRRYFDNFKLGKALGMRPCRFCQPPAEKFVSAKIVDLKSEAKASDK